MHFILKTYLICFQRGAEVHVVPWNYDFTNEHFDGLFLSNGPGDPSLAMDTVTNLRKVYLDFVFHFLSL